MSFEKNDMAIPANETAETKEIKPVERFRDYFDEAKEQFAAGVQENKDILIASCKEVKNHISNNTCVRSLKETCESVCEKFKDSTNSFIDVAVAALDGVVEVSNDGLKETANFCKDSADAVFDRLTDVLKTAVGTNIDDIESVADASMEAIAEIGGIWNDDFKEKVIEIANAEWSDKVTTVTDGIFDAADSLFGEITSLAKEVIDFAADVTQETYEVVKNTGYEVVKSTVENVEGFMDASLTVAADIMGMWNEDAKQKVVEFITKDYSSNLVSNFESLNSGKLDEMGELGAVIKTVARATGAVLAGTLIGSPTGTVLSWGVGEYGNNAEKYYQAQKETTYLSDGKGHEIAVQTINTNSDLTAIMKQTIDGCFEGAKDFASNSLVAGERVGATVLDAAGNFTVGVTKFVEGTVDSAASVAGLIPSLRDGATSFIKTDFTGETVGRFFDSITVKSHLNESKIGELAEGICRGLGQIAPAVALTVLTSGTSLSSQIVVCGMKTGVTAASLINLGALSASAQGNAMESALNDKDGTTYERAYIYSVVSGAMEGGIEAITGGIGVYGPGLIKEFGETMLGSALGEGLEEIISGVLDPLAKKIYKDTDLKETYQGAEFWEDIAKQFVTAFGIALIAKNVEIHIQKNTVVLETVNENGDAVKVYGDGRIVCEGEIKTFTDQKGNIYRVGNDLLPNHTYELNGYKYTTDGMGRIVKAEGYLQVKNHDGRLEIVDSIEAVGKGDQLDTDHRGHLIGDQFNGNNSLANLIPQDAIINMNDFREMECYLREQVDAGKEVYYIVEPVYEGNSFRPTDICVTYTINGETFNRIFPNRS